MAPDISNICTELHIVCSSLDWIFKEMLKQIPEMPSSLNIELSHKFDPLISELVEYLRQVNPEIVEKYFFRNC